MHDRVLPIISALLVVVSLEGALLGQPAQSVCPNSTWSNCGIAVKQELQTKPSDPKKVIQLAMLWGAAYDAQYNELRKKSRLQTSTPDSDKIFEQVSSKLNPVDIATDKALDALVKKFLPRVAPVLEWASSPLAVALKAFFDSSEIASDYDELRLMNDAIQNRVAILLQPYLKPDWKDLLKHAVQDAAPQLRKP